MLQCAQLRKKFGGKPGQTSDSDAAVDRDRAENPDASRSSGTPGELSQIPVENTGRQRPLLVDDAVDESAALLRSSYSPLHGEATAPELGHANAPWRAAGSAFRRPFAPRPLATMAAGAAWTAIRIDAAR
jgi:hypothetical protein